MNCISTKSELVGNVYNPIAIIALFIEVTIFLNQSNDCITKP